MQSSESKKNPPSSPGTGIAFKATTDFIYDFANHLGWIDHQRGVNYLNNCEHTYDPLSRSSSVVSGMDGHHKPTPIAGKMD